MKVTFVGGGSGPEGSPRVWATDRNTLIVQGYRVTDAEALTTMGVPAHEEVVEIPRELARHFPHEDV
ncbi:MAG: hypothetical protein ACRDN9_07535 [Streptosporangiaceae bacterium]